MVVRRNVRGGGMGQLNTGAVALAASIVAGGVVDSALAAGKVKVDRVAAGSATFNQVGPVLTIRATDRTIINYRQFDVPRGDTVRFVQPSATSRVLNRIAGAAPSRIDGTITANGIVYFVNPAGMMFGKGAVVNVGQIYAAAGTITDANFLASVNRFTGTGAVVNEGAINAQAVALIGRTVANAGTISAEGGVVTVVAGDDVMLGTRDGHMMVKVGTTTGQQAVGAGASTLAGGDMFALAIGGAVRAKEVNVQSAGNAVVNGKLDASSADGNGGSIAVTGRNVALTGATLDASGATGGGRVLVGGDLHGQGTLANATNTAVDAGTKITASATQNGDGGKVVVWSDNKTTYNGSIYAKGGATSGNGGNVEVSGKGTLAFNGTVDTTAPNGAVGSLLLDPTDIDIVDSGPDVHGDTSNQDISGDINAGDDPGATSVITASGLRSLLDGNNVSLAATHDINVGSAIDCSVNAAGGNLTMNAGHDVNVTNSIALKNSNLTLIAGNRVSLAADINTTGGDVSITSSGDVLGGAGRITANHLTIEAAAGIGGGSPVLTALSGGLEAHAAAGNIEVSDSGTLNLGFAGGTKNGVVADAGDVTASAVNGINVTAAGHRVVAAGNVSLTTTGAAGTIATDNYDLTGNGQVESAGGYVHLTADGNVTLGATAPGDVHAAGDVQVTSVNGSVVIDNATRVVSTGGNVSLAAGNAVRLLQTLTDGAAVQAQSGNLSIDALAFESKSNGIPVSVRAAGDVSIIADSVDFTDQIRSDTGSVVFATRTPGVNIVLADAPAGGALTLTGSELAGVTGAVVEIGDSNTGRIDVAGSINQPGTWNTLHLVSGGAVSDAAGGTIQVDNLAVSAASGIDLSKQAHAVGTFAAENVGAGGIKFTNGADLTIGSVAVIGGNVTGVQSGGPGGAVVISSGGRLGVDVNGATVSAAGNVALTGATVVVAGNNAPAVESTGGAVTLRSTVDDVLVGSAGAFGDLRGLTRVTVSAARNAVIDEGSVIGSTGGAVTVSGGSAVRFLQTNQAGARVSSGGGSISLTAPSVTSQSGGVPSTLVSGGGDVAIHADGLTLLDGIDAGAGALTIAPYTPGLAISLADAPVGGRLTVTGAQLGSVTAGKVVIGDATSGDISVAGTVNQPGTWNTLHLVTAGGVSDAAGGTIQVDNLAVTSGTGVDLANQAQFVETFAATNTAPANVSIREDASLVLRVGTVDGVAGISTAGGDVRITADGLDIASNVDAGSGVVAVANQSAGTALDLGSAADNAGTLGLSIAELDRVTASVLRVGSPDAGAVNFTDVNDSAAGWHVLHVSTGSTVGETGAIAAGSLAIDAGGPVILSAGNTVGTLAVSAPTSTLAFHNSADLTIGTVDGVAGVTTSGLTQIATDQALTLSAGVNPGAGNLLTLEGDGGITQTAGAVTADQLAVYSTGGGAALTSATNQIASVAATVASDFSMANAAGFNVASVNGLPGIAANGDVVLSPGGGATVTFLGVVSGATLLVNGPADIANGGVTTTGAQTYAGAVTLGSDATLTGSGITFGSTVDGAQALTISGDATFGGVVGSVTPLTSLTVSGSTTINAAAVTTAGVQQYGGPVTLGADVTLTAAPDVIFDGTVDGAHSLAVLGDVQFADQVGSNAALTSLSVTGATSLNGGLVTTTGAQSYTGAVSLGTNNTLAGSTVTFASAVDGASALGVSGNAIFNAAVGSTTPLVSLAVTGNTTLNDGHVTTSGTQNYAAVTLGANAAVAGTLVTFNGTVDGAFSMGVTGNASIKGAVGSTTPLTSLAVSGATNLQAGTAHTTGVQSYAGAVTLGGDDTLTASAVSFGSTIDGAHALAVAGNAAFSGAIGSTTALSSLSVSGASSLGGNSVITTGGQTYAGAVTLLANQHMTGSLVSFGSAVDGPDSLEITGNASLGGAVGGTGMLTGLAISGTTALNAGVVKTGGIQSYGGAVTLGTNATLTASAVSFVSTVDGAHVLTVAGNASFGGAVGNTTALSGLSVSGATTLAAGSVKTTAGQTYAGAVTLGADETLTGSLVTFGSAVDGGRSLTVSGNAAFHGTVGSPTPLASLLVSGATALDAGSVRTGGNQTYAGATTLGQDTVLSGANITLAALDGNLHALTLTGSGATTLSAVSGVTSLVSNGGGSTRFNGAVAASNVSVSDAVTFAGGSVTTTGAQTYSAAATLASDLAASGTTITFGSTLDGAHALNVTGGSTLLVLDGAVGSQSPLASLSAAGPVNLGAATVTTSGAQDYQGLLAMSLDTSLSGSGVRLRKGAVGATAGGQSLTINGGATINDSLGSAATPLKSLTITGPAAFDPAAGAAITVTTTGDQSFAGDVTTTGDVTLMSPAGHVTFDASVAAGGDLTVHGASGITVGGDLAGTAGTEVVTLETDWTSADHPGVIAFTGSGNVSGLGSLLLQHEGLAGTIPQVATVTAANDFTVSVADRFLMDPHQKLTAVAGDIDIQVPGGTATLGDLNAPGNITVHASQIVLIGRPAGQVLARTAGSSTPSLVTDAGLDIVAGGAITLDAASLSFAPLTDRFVALSSYSGNVGPASAINQLTAAGGTVLVLRLDNPVTAADLTFNGTVLDLPLSGASVVNPATVRAAMTRVTLPSPDQQGGIGASALAWLEDVGVHARDLTDAELVDGLDGRGMYMQDPDPVLLVATPRLSAEALSGVRESYVALFYTEKKADDGSTQQVSADEEVRKALASAVEAYTAAHPGDAVDPLAFRRFLETTPEQHRALAYLNKVRALLVQVEFLGLTEREMRDVRAQICRRVKPAGLDQETFIAAALGPKQLAIATPSN